MRISLSLASALILGFCLGWFLRPGAKHAAPASSVPAPIGSLSPATGTTPSSAASAPLPTSSSVKDPGVASQNRIETLRWLRRSGAPVHIHAFARNGFSPALVKILGLSPAESTRLNDAAIDAQQRIDDARQARVSTSTSEDGQMLTVDVPAIDAATSREIYDRLLGTLKSTLGPERSELFNELTGESFESGFDQFGLNNIRYELTLNPTYPETGAPAHFEYKRHSVDPTGLSRGSSGSNVSVAQIDKYDPILGRFVPTQLRNLSAK
jgi:hypothetical protein